MMNSVATNAIVTEEPDAFVVGMERRIFRLMCVTVACVVAVSLLFAPWRVTTGLLLGGLLSLLNHHWLRTSVAAAFAVAADGARPRWGITRYVFRYAVAASVIASAVMFDVVSLTATLAGLCSFVVAALVEALVQIYQALVNGKE
ncbi:MAG: ATP synthase subunit I [Pyrinomonadaceae bacterium]|nr:ATP synthase subunit I [Pyrinomonadaceae bacterium]